MATLTGVVRQAAAIPVLGGRVCLVSSRSGKRWVVPKGCLEPGKSAGEIALQEAWEEAGLVGSLQCEPVGTYLYQKDDRLCHVLVFLMQVTRAADAWPEDGWRDRSWMSHLQAARSVDDEGLRELIRGVIPARGEVRPAKVGLDY